VAAYACLSRPTVYNALGGLRGKVVGHLAEIGVDRFELLESFLNGFNRVIVKSVKDVVKDVVKNLDKNLYKNNYNSIESEDNSVKDVVKILYNDAQSIDIQVVENDEKSDTQQYSSSYSSLYNISYIREYIWEKRGDARGDQNERLADSVCAELEKKRWLTSKKQPLTEQALKAFITSRLNADADLSFSSMVARHAPELAEHARCYETHFKAVYGVDYTFGQVKPPLEGLRRFVSRLNANLEERGKVNKGDDDYWQKSAAAFDALFKVWAGLLNKYESDDQLPDGLFYAKRTFFCNPQIFGREKNFTNVYDTLVNYFKSNGKDKKQTKYEQALTEV
jgi:hypothetical protein